MTAYCTALNCLRKQTKKTNKTRVYGKLYQIYDKYVWLWVICIIIFLVISASLHQATLDSAIFGKQESSGFEILTINIDKLGK